jgi:hypothetical protein
MVDVNHCEPSRAGGVVGDVYVFDGGAATNYKFDASGNPVDFAATGSNETTGVNAGGASENEIAVGLIGRDALHSGERAKRGDMGTDNGHGGRGGGRADRARERLTAEPPLDTDPDRSWRYAGAVTARDRPP